MCLQSLLTLRLAVQNNAGFGLRRREVFVIAWAGTPHLGTLPSGSISPQLPTVLMMECALSHQKVPCCFCWRNFLHYQGVLQSMMKIPPDLVYANPRSYGTAVYMASCRVYTINSKSFALADLDEPSSSQSCESKEILFLSSLGGTR